MMLSKVALAIDCEDWKSLKACIKAVGEDPKIYDWETPDNIYRCIYWEEICWETQEAMSLRKAVSDIRHNWVQITEEGRIVKDVLSCDSRGSDEEFDELLSWQGDICWFYPDTPLTPINGKYIPLSRERLHQILTSYIKYDYEAAGEEYIYDTLSSVADHTEIEALGFGFCIPYCDAQPAFRCIYPEQEGESL